MKRIDCNLCSHCKSNVIEVQCSKGHSSEHRFSSTRSGCIDYSEMSIPERLAKRFGSSWQGGTDLKPMQSEARRTASTLSKAATRFKDVLTSSEHEALLNARNVCVRLGDQLEVAVRVAEQTKKDAERARKRAREEARQAVLAQFDEVALAQMAIHAGRYLGTAGAIWRRAKMGYATSVDGLESDFDRTLRQLREGEPVTHAVRQALGEFVVEMRDRDRGYNFKDGNWREFEQFSATHAQLQAEVDD